MITDWTKYSWEDFLDKTEKHNIVIWGCGQIASEVIYLLKRKRNISHLVDANPAKIGTDFEGYKIEASEDVFSKGFDGAVLICSLYLTDIARKLEEYGVKEYFSAFFMMRKDLWKEIVTEIPDEGQLSLLKGLLADRRSADIVDKIVEKRRTRNIDYSDIMTREEYLLDDIFTFYNDEVYVDAGAFDGDTIIAFIKKVRNFKKIYCFEADKVNYEKMKLRLQLAQQVYGEDRIRCFNVALCDYIGRVPFVSLGSEASKVDTVHQAWNNENVDCVTIDSVLKDASYIKMDIEGSELGALKGAKELIKRCKPKMAVCIYHRPEDLWQIPIYIHSLVPEYRMFIRHHGNIYYDTVLYATL